MRPSLPSSSLFPYTTLFRSGSARDARYAAASSSVWRSRPKSMLRVVRLDRKSTRLNSSHRCISYAVFCLKKKTNAAEGHILEQHEPQRHQPAQLRDDVVHSV